MCIPNSHPSDNCVKDVTSRYASDWMHSTRKLRVAPKWWQAVLASYCDPDLDREKKENIELKGSSFHHFLVTPSLYSVSYCNSTLPVGCVTWNVIAFGMSLHTYELPSDIVYVCKRRRCEISSFLDLTILKHSLLE